MTRELVATNKDASVDAPKAQELQVAIQPILAFTN